MFGNGIALPITAGMDVNETVTISTATLTLGMHTIYVRGQDDRGQWSHFESQPVFKDPNRLVNTIEYAFDTDPGNGMGIQVPYIEPLDAEERNLIIPSTGLILGDHTLYLRVQDGSEAWSLTSNRPFEVVLPPPGNALDFDGMDDHVAIADDDAVFDRAGGLTLEAWIKPANLNGSVQHIVGINDSYRLAINAQDQLEFQTSDGITPTSATIPAALLEQDQVTHVAATFDGVDIARLYIDGLLIHEQTGMSIPQNLADAFYIGGLAGTESFEGQIDEVRLWDADRNEAEIQSTQYLMLNLDLNQPVPGLVAYYRFDQGLGNGNNTSPPVNMLPDRTVSANDGNVINFNLDGLSSNWVPSEVPLVTGGVIQADEDALVDLYFALGGSNWADNSNWLTGDVSTWFGVTVVSNRVRAINLPDNNLTGDIPASLTDLTGLTTLDISGNEVTSLP